MKKEYKAPIFKTIDLSTESPLLANSDPLFVDGSPENDNEGNNFSNRRGGIWGDTEW